MHNSDENEQLFSSLRRIAMSVKAATRLDDRRRLLVLEAELRLVRSDLYQRCDLLAKKMNEAGAQLNAVNAYARCASFRRNRPSSE